MGPWILPVLAAVVEIFASRKADVAKSVGISEDAVARVGNVVGDLLSKDEKLLAQASAEIEKARQHDVATSGKAPPIVELLRGLVRPLVTLGAFLWYVYARANGIEMAPEDYAIIGGVVAFWFGFRPFEKRDVTVRK
jgi:hypothetical protein